MNNIHPTAIIGDNVILGDNNIIGAYCVIGGPYWCAGRDQCNGNVHIGDGNTISSQALFDLYTLHHGLEPGTAKAKTVVYERRGDNIVMIKRIIVL